MQALTAVYLVCSFLGFFLPSIAVIPQFHAERIGIFMQVFWTGGSCLLYFLNGIIWRKDTLNRAPVFCDITVYFGAGAHGGMIACTLCVLRRLHTLLDLANRTPTALEKRRMIITDLLITLGIPMVYMGIYGCMPARHNTIVDIVTMLASALILALISVICGVRNAMKIRRIYSQMRATEYFNADQTANRYFRVMALSCVDIFFTIPFLIYLIVWDSKRRSPWISWEDTKWGFSRIDSYPPAVWRSSREATLLMELTRWVPILVAYVWLAFFGYTNETRRLYGPILRRLWESTPFASRRPALEPLTFGSAAVKDLRHREETSDFSGSFSSINYSTPTVMNRKDEGIKALTTLSIPLPPDVESQPENREGTGGRSLSRWRLWFKGTVNP